MEKRLREIFGDNLINIIKEWPQLNKDDIKEIQDMDITHIYAVYDSWEDIAKSRLERGDCEEYIRPFVDIKALAEHISIKEKNSWIELESGKLLVVK